MFSVKDIGFGFALAGVLGAGSAWADSHDGGAQFYGKLGAGNVTEMAIEGHFFADACGWTEEDPACPTGTVDQDYAEGVQGAAHLSKESFELDGGSAFGAAVGVDFGYVRVEGGVDRLDAQALAGTAALDGTVFHGTVFGDLPVGEYFEVFGGVGLDYVDAEANFANGLGGTFEGEGDGWHYELGAAYRINSRVTLEASYRRTSTGLEFELPDGPDEGDAADKFDIDADTDVLRAGLRFAFG